MNDLTLYKSGVGMSYFKSIFEKSKTKNKMDRLKSIYKIVGKSDNDEILKKIKSQIQVTKHERNQVMKEISKKNTQNSFNSSKVVNSMYHGY